MAVKEEVIESLIKDLKKKKIYTRDVEKFLSYVSLENLIFLKLEISARKLNSKLFGFYLLSNVNSIVKDALVKFADHYGKTKTESATILGVRKSQYARLLKKFKG